MTTKKQTYIQLHKLGMELVKHLSETDGMTHGDAPEYFNQNVRPTAIHMSKDGHKDATFTLFHEISEFVSEEDMDGTPETEQNSNREKQLAKQ